VRFKTTQHKHKTKQNKTKQNKTKQSKAKQNKQGVEPWWCSKVVQRGIVCLSGGIISIILWKIFNVENDVLL
jgi:preprotein translocase subunit SecF